MYQRHGVEVVADAATEILVELWRECFHAGQQAEKLARRFSGCLSRYREAA